MLKPRTPEFRYLAEYLKTHPGTAPMDASGVRPLVVGGAGFAVFIASLPLTFGVMAVIAATTSGFGIAFAVLPFLMSLLIGWLTTVGVRKILPKPDPAKDAIIRRRAEAVRPLHDLQTSKKLHENMDPMVIQLLEAGAWHYSRIMGLLNGPAWVSPNSGRAQMKEQIVEAAEEGMADLVSYARTCIGPVHKETKEVANDMVHSALNLELVDTLQKLRGLSSPDSWVDYAHRSPNAPLVFEPMKEIALRLRELGDELEQRAMGQDISAVPTSESSLALQNLVGELKATRQAEEELGQRF